MVTTQVEGFETKVIAERATALPSSVRAALDRLRPPARERCSRCTVLAPVAVIDVRGRAFCRACRPFAPVGRAEPRRSVPAAPAAPTRSAAGAAELAYWRRRVQQHERDAAR